MLLALLPFLLFMSNPNEADLNSSELLIETSRVDADSVLRHVVLFGFTAEATATDVSKIEMAFADLADKIEGIVDFEWGTNVSPEELDQGHTHCFVVSFDSEQSRDDYLPHPDHKAFVDLAGPFIENVTVIDYWTMTE